MQVKLRYGINEISKDIVDGTSVGELAGNVGIRSVLSLPESWRAVVNGVQVNSDYEVRAGDTITFETAANTKA